MGFIPGRNLENCRINLHKGLGGKKSPRGLNHPGAADEERPPVAVNMRLPPGRSFGRDHWCQFAGNSARKSLRFFLGAFSWGEPWRPFARKCSGEKPEHR